MRRCSRKAFAMCPTRHLCGSIEDATFDDHSECAAFNKCVEEKPMTNGDRIRAMSDDELAVFLSRGFKEPCYYCELAASQATCTVTSCDAAMMKWLQQPAEGGQK